MAFWRYPEQAEASARRILAEGVRLTRQQRYISAVLTLEKARGVMLERGRNNEPLVNELTSAAEFAWAQLGPSREGQARQCLAAGLATRSNRRCD